MAKKDFTVNLRKDTRAMTSTPSPAPATSGLKAIEVPEEKKKVGRPKVKTEPEKTINISVPVSLLEKMNVAKAKYSNNLTRYVNAVIEADLDANYEKYLKIQKILNS